MNDNIICLWDRLKETKKPIILYGMGDGAQKIMTVLDSLGIKISGFMASDDFVRGHSFAGFEVKRLSDIEREFKDFIILVCFGTSIPQVMDRIKTIAKSHELYAPDVPVIGGGLFDLSYARENKDKLEAVYNRLADEQSRRVFRGWVLYRITGDISYITKNQTEKEELNSFFSLSDDEIYVDLGAYTGDTAEQFIRDVNGKYRHIYALEPDGRNYGKMLKRLENADNFTPVNAGVYYKDCIMQFVQRGGRNSTLIPYEKGHPTDKKIRDIEMKSVDSLLFGGECTYIKMDVEGSEAHAIKGAEHTISVYKPKLNIALYHRTEDIFDLPLKILALNNDYKLYLRQHPYIPAWDMNLYCI